MNSGRISSYWHTLHAHCTHVHTHTFVVRKKAKKGRSIFDCYFVVVDSFVSVRMEKRISKSRFVFACINTTQKFELDMDFPHSPRDSYSLFAFPLWCLCSSRGKKTDNNETTDSNLSCNLRMWTRESGGTAQMYWVISHLVLYTISNFFKGEHF